MVRRARKQRGMSQVDLAKAAKLSTNVVGYIERGGSYSDASLEDVALVLGWPVGGAEAFLRGDDGALPDPPERQSSTERFADIAVPGRADRARERILAADDDELLAMRDVYREVMGADAADRWLIRAISMREAAARREQEQQAEPEAHRNAG